jgi:hypothetical protein
MTGTKQGQGSGDLPRTDLQPEKRPYQDDYFGTGEEEGVVREREAAGDEEDEGPQAA